MQEKHYTTYVTNAVNSISRHLTYVVDAVTLIEDSETIRSNMKQIYETEQVDKKEALILDDIDAPITYVNVFTNRAISAAAIYAQDEMIYYFRSGSSMDTALERCAKIYEQYKYSTNKKGEFVSDGGSPYVYWVKDYVNIYDGRIYGKIVLEVMQAPSSPPVGNEPAAATYNYQVDLSTYPNTQYFLYNLSGTVVFSNNPEDIGSLINYTVPRALRDSEGVVMDSEDYEVTTDYLYKQRLHYYFFTPVSDIYAYTRTTFGYFLGGVGILMVVLFSILVIILERIKSPFKSLERYGEMAAEYKDAIPSFEPKYAEIENVCQIITGKMKTISTLKNAEADYELKMKDAKIQTLQSQITPHFLFNMLDTIGWKAEQSNFKDLSDMITRLGDLIREDILLNGKEKITIGQELDYIKNYLSLQQIRYGNSFEYVINVDEELLHSCYIPKLSFQPVVENSVVHGISKVNRPGLIIIDIWEDMDCIICRITDNGIGFDSTGFFERPPRTIPPSAHLHSHIALHNIQNRIQMLYGERFGITIDSEIGKGTVTMITLPIDTNPPEEGAYQGG
ncbi:MAG: sensor histidine kinase [Christensenellales bacterium]